MLYLFKSTTSNLTIPKLQLFQSSTASAVVVQRLPRLHADNPAATIHEGMSEYQYIYKYICDGHTYATSCLPLCDGHVYVCFSATAIQETLRLVSLIHLVKDLSLKKKNEKTKCIFISLTQKHMKSPEFKFLANLSRKPVTF